MPWTDLSLRMRRAGALMCGAASVALAAAAPMQAGARGAVAPPALEHGDALDGAARSVSLAAPEETALLRSSPPHGAEIEPSTPYRTAVKAALADAPEAVRLAYAASGYAPVWSHEDFSDIRDGAPRLDWSRGQSLVAALAIAETHALPARRAERARLSERLDAAEVGELSRDEAAALERDLTLAYLTLAEALAGGVVDPGSVSRDIDVAPVRPETAAFLDAARDAADATALLESYAPQTDDYRAMVGLYAGYRAEAAQGGWGPVVPAGAALRLNESGPRVGALFARLLALGHLPMDAEPALNADGEPVFDARLDGAVRAFQTSHGLEVDGVVGSQSLAELNRTPDDRAMQIAVNLERARWRAGSMAQDEGRQFQVNIPDFHVTLYENGRVIYRTRVVVGEPEHQTPEFTDQMTHVVVNPTWTVPYSIATKELLPIFQRDPSEIFRRDMRVLAPGGGEVDPWSIDWSALSRGNFPYLLRQNPGPRNALGDVKFIFPNHHAVYLHDTPARHLFNEDVRAFSHGCIRVAEPALLAEVLLEAQHPTPGAYYQSLLGDNERFVTLDRPVPIHILYRTAWVDDRGVVQYRPDIYGRDDMLAAALRDAGVAGS